VSARADKRVLSSPQAFATWQERRQHRRQLHVLACWVAATVLLAALMTAVSLSGRWA